MSTWQTHSTTDCEPAAASTCGDVPVQLSVVVPAYDPGPELARCLSALRADAGDGTEIVVADDGSAQDLRTVCEAFGARLVRLERNRGRGPARNAGWRASDGDWVLFVDADVVVRPGTIAEVKRIIALNPDWVAFFGSYDDAPAAPGSVSQYRNLLHHFRHQVTGTTAPHFWTGLGAIRRVELAALGGFDEARWARAMEEIDLGARLVAAGHRIHVVPGLQATHLKRYTLASMLRSDFAERALPWSTYLLERRRERNAFVLSSDQRLSAAGAAACVAGALLALLGGPATGGVLAGAGLIAFLGANRQFFRFLLAKRGAGLAMLAVPFHLLHSLAAVAGFAVALGRVLPRKLGASLRPAIEPR